MKCSKGLLLLICIMEVAFAAMSQSTAQERAERNFKHFNFERAAEIYKNSLAKNPADISLREKLARTYVLMEDHSAAEAEYEQIIKGKNPLAVNKLYYALELRANGKYDQAAKMFDEYAQLVPDDSRSKELNTGAGIMKALATDNKVYEIKNLKELNSPASEIGIAPYRNGTYLFSSNRGEDPSVIRHDIWTGKIYYGLYAAAISGGKISPVKIKGSLRNRKFHEGPAVVSEDGKELFFTRSNYRSGHTVKSKDNKVKLKIMHADWDDNKQQWVNVKDISIDNDEYSVAQPALSKDGRRLYFMSDMPGGLGETDIYVSYRDANGNWGPAINLGPGVNTKGREMFPYISADGTLYFSSDARAGLGGLDIYAAGLINGEWGNAQNLGAPVNSAADDFGINTPDNINGYFISNRPGGEGEDDIYSFRKIGVTICGTVISALNRLPIGGAAVKLMDGENASETKTTGDKGDFCFTVQPNRKYKVMAVKKDYEPFSIPVATATNQSISLPLSKMGGIDLSVCVKQAGAGTTLTGATVEITNKNTGERKGCVIKADCSCHFDLEPNSDYSFCAYKDPENNQGSYDNPCKTFTTKGKSAPASIFENLEMTYLEENQVIKIENLYYDVNKWDIRPDAAIELDKLVVLMHKFPNMEIELSSHTDCRGAMKANDELSTKRARSCVDYLTAHGIDSKRMVAVGYGERKLLNNCSCEGNIKSSCTEEQHQQNRRTEFKVIRLK